MMLKRESNKSLASVSRHYITIQAKALTDDGEGGLTETWTDSNSVFASLDPITAKQHYELMSVGVDATHRVKMSGLIEIGESDRIKFGSRTFEVLTIENIQERDFLKVVTCKEER